MEIKYFLSLSPNCVFIHKRCGVEHFPTTCTGLSDASTRQWWFYTTVSVVGSYASVMVLYYLFCGWIICVSDGSIILRFLWLDHIICVSGGSILPVLWLDHMRQWWFYTTCSVIGSYASVMVLYYLFCGWIICVSDGSILPVLWLDHMRQWWFYTTCSVVGLHETMRCMIRTSSKRIYWSSVIVLHTHLPARLVYPWLVLCGTVVQYTAGPKTVHNTITSHKGIVYRFIDFCNLMLKTFDILYFVYWI